MKNKHSASQFPKNYRFITELNIFKSVSNYWFRLPNQSKTKKSLIILSISCFFILIPFLFLGISVVGLKFYENIKTYNKLSLQRENLQNQKNFWQSVSQKYGSYKDAYFRMALLDYRLGDFEKAKEENNKALLLDPNYNDAKSLQKILDTK